ncbi:sigma D regulator [Porticoccus sp. W117]|uniref:sigma D regulator n=1 Tax=Porticoccus sp. W117 TaxID=3054777 RepID=UPI002594C6BE|nr:sigma D regulator [Porticoccus sp. W117]MDM3870434.1 sigma D regulator [Porticoccus sp. W117]
MLEDCKSLQERWGGVSNIIDRWLQNRQELLVGYCELSNVPEFDSGNPEHGNQLQSLCENLVDYISAGHFEVYQQLMEEGRAFGDKEALSEASQLLTDVHHATQAALDFNDKYLATDDLETLTVDLSQLGESLAARFEIEDRMIEVLHNAHQEQVKG